jgi:hypothetical protein
MIMSNNSIEYDIINLPAISKGDILNCNIRVGDVAKFAWCDIHDEIANALGYDVNMTVGDHLDNNCPDCSKVYEICADFATFLCMKTERVH